MRRDRRIIAVGKKALHQLCVGSIDLNPVLKRNLCRLGVGAFHQANARPQFNRALHVRRRPMQVCLDHNSDLLGELLVQRLEHPHGDLGVG